MGSGPYPTGETMDVSGGRAAAILLAGGKGARAGFSGNKAYVPVAGIPMVGHSLETLDRSSRVVRLVMVIRPRDRELARRVIEETAISTPWLMVSGGESRHQSEDRGLAALSHEIADQRIDLVAIHDAARPFVTPTLLDTLFQDALRHGGAVPTLPFDGPVHRVSEGRELVLLEQPRLHRAQTPQVFGAAPLALAYRRARQAGFEGVDTAETVERFSDLAIRATPGDPQNTKLTFPEDFGGDRSVFEGA